MKRNIKTVKSWKWAGHSATTHEFDKAFQKVLDLEDTWAKDWHTHKLSAMKKLHPSLCDLAKLCADHKNKVDAPLKKLHDETEKLNDMHLIKRRKLTKESSDATPEC